MEEDSDDIIPLLMFLQVAVTKQDDLLEDLKSLLMLHIREQRRLNAALPQDKTRVVWDGFVSNITSAHFRRMFRMDIDCFQRLCLLIERSIGGDVF